MLPERKRENEFVPKKHTTKSPGEPQKKIARAGGRHEEGAGRYQQEHQESPETQGQAREGLRQYSF